jgi:hypothetical protein
MDYEFMLQIVEDGAVTYSGRYNNALEAVNAYNKIVDYGFCHIWREAVLVEPNGKTHSKIFERPGSPKYAVN